jgi:mono/diheme cytochrome c family protein
MGSKLRLLPRQRRQRQHRDGKKLGVKDYTKDQGFSDAEAANVIKNGRGEMKAYKGKLSDADVKALVAYVRSLKR